MSNPLSTSASPQAPEPQQAGAQQGANALAGPSQSSAGAGKSVASIPAPTNAQTVTALRHFSAIEQELSELMKDPDLGKTDMRSKVIDGMTRLVSEGLVPASGAVRDLGTFPERPYDQRVWVNKHFMNTVMAQVSILAHHQAGAATGQNVEPDWTADPDDHQSIIAGLTARYGAGQ